MADHADFPRPDAGPLALSDRAVGPVAAKALTAEVARHPGPKTVLVVGVTSGDTVVDRVLGVIMPNDQVIVVADGPVDDLLGSDETFAGRVTVRKDLPAELPTPVDVAVVARPALHPTVVDRIRPLLAADGVLTVATDATASDPLSGVVDDHAVRTDRVFRSFPPLRVHQLRFTPATPHLAARLGPAEVPSHVAVTKRMGIDSNGVAFGGLALGAAALTKLVRPRSKAWLVPAALALPVAAFFRDPRRIVPDDPQAVVSSADGKVLAVERLTDTRFGTDEWLRISVFLSVLDVHVNRSPVAGRVVSVLREEGGYANAMTAAAEHNVACYTVLETVHGRVVVAQRSGLIARRIVNRAGVGALLAKGERYGLIRFGSRTDVYLPATAAEPLVSPGERVVGGETVLARWT
ncbi:phosphatidylserine decarboxylase [Cryptosporangium phraense]|uniref:Phosphatidylserine decarboxylase family protein n=1 Tax=Cryptosporangium phraense TaxID=2593070 RepID=A0A545AYL9_9ACTN|nr:phosphatidylserine decarboxylase [Cryptosporangium phraense]TQS46426.1 phosphatidylserine decarboxylase family protein [Cryptosporangium phraense]